MVEPPVLNPRPAMVLGLLGGLVGMLLLVSLLYLAPAFGLPLIDLGLLLGGVITGHQQIAPWLGFWLFFLGGVFVITPNLLWLWPRLPGRGVGFLGAAVKGLIWGVLVWLVTGLLIVLLAWLNQQPVANPGLFGLHFGWPGALVLLVAHLAYGLAAALVAAVGQAIEPIDAIGWPGYRQAETPDLEAEYGERLLRRNGQPRQAQ